MASVYLAAGEAVERPLSASQSVHALIIEVPTVAEIRRQTNHHDNNIRKWIHRFNSHGIDGIVSRKHNHTAQKITDDIEKEMVPIT